MSTDQKKYGEEIQKMIRELAKGNFSYRITEFSEDELGDIAVMINLLAEELSVFFIQPGLFGEKRLSEQFILVMDEHYSIHSINYTFSHFMERSPQLLIGQSIKGFIVPNSFKKLQKQLDDLTQAAEPKPMVKLLLTFVQLSSHQIDTWVNCQVLYGNKHTYYIVRGLKLMDRITGSENHVFPSGTFKSRNASILQLRTDIEKIRAVHHYVSSHLHETLPSIAALSRLFLVNEYKLKRGFRELYQTSIFKLHLEMRLAQSIVMIKNTPISLKVIAYSLGFTSFPHFSKVFKEKYGHPPSYYRK